MLWICAVVGAGVANAVPGALLVADAGISPAGVLARWQLSQVLDDGMCELAPTGDVGGMITMLLMPANDAVGTSGPWHAAQLLVMPVWLIREPENRAPFGTGVAAMLDPAPTWQLSQLTVVGM